jgi:hypothetical protein
MSYQTIGGRFREPVCVVQFAGPEASNTIDDCLIEEDHEVLASCEVRPAGEPPITVVVLQTCPTSATNGIARDFGDGTRRKVSP